MLLRLLPYIFSLVCASVPFYFSGEVVRVVEGDTIVIQHGDRMIPVRLYGIETPASNQAYYEEARRFTEELVLGKLVTVNVGMVSLPDGSLLNLELVKNGLAWWSRKYAPQDSTLARLEMEAKSAKLGLWSQRHPKPPWELRDKLTKDLTPTEDELKKMEKEAKKAEKKRQKKQK